MQLLRIAAVTVFSFWCLDATSFSQQTGGGDEVLTNETVVKLVRAGLGDDIIIDMVNSRPGKYSVDSEAVIALKQAGVSENVISAVLRRNTAEGGSVPQQTEVPKPSPLAKPVRSVATEVPAPGSPRKLTVVARSHSRTERDFTVTTPQTTDTNCDLYPNSVSCHSTTYGGGSQNKAVYRFVEVVTANENGKATQYTLARTVRWVWNSMDWLNDGESFPAEIKGKQMFITARRVGIRAKRKFSSTK